jgi:hypothetical protein
MGQRVWSVAQDHSKLAARHHLTKSGQAPDLEREMQVVQQQIGDTVLLLDDTPLVGFAVCHGGAGTEGATSECSVKFGAVHPGLAAGQH